MVVLVLLTAVTLVLAGYALFRRNRKLASLQHRHSMRGLFTAQRYWHGALALCVIALSILMFTERVPLRNSGSSVLAGLGLILLFEIWPAWSINSWRRESKRGGWIRVGSTPALSIVGLCQLVLVIAAIFQTIRVLMAH